MTENADVEWLRTRIAALESQLADRHAERVREIDAHTERVAGLEAQLRLANIDAANNEAELNDLRDCYRWRRVENEMPEAWTNVLAWAPDLAISVVVYYDDTEEPGWFNAWSENQMELTLTHWMPLPPATEEGE